MARGVSLYLLDLNGGAGDVSGNGIARLFLTIVSAFAEFERDRIGGEPHAPQKERQTPGDEAYSFGCPREMRNARSCTVTNVATGEEVWRRQLSQWQWVVSTASPANSNWIAPHRQRPVVVICLLPKPAEPEPISLM